MVKKSPPHRPETPDKKTPETGKLTVRELVSARGLGLDLELLQPEGLENEIRSVRIQKLGMALAGFTGYIHSDRIQVYGSSEYHFLTELDADALAAAAGRLRKHKICCIVVTKALAVPEVLLQVAAEERIPVLRTSALSSIAAERMISYLERRLAPRQTVHGVLLEIFGLGVLVLGPSGIGKSECALELVLKGHRLIADDFVELTRLGLDRLIGSGGEVLKHHMEVRGLGIINIRELFGISAIGSSQSVDLAVRLERWRPDAEYDRLGLDRHTMEFLGVEIPLVVMPVAPGRNVATLVEVAARVQLQRQRIPLTGED